MIQDLSGSWCIKGTDESTLVIESSVKDNELMLCSTRNYYVKKVVFKKC